LTLARGVTSALLTLVIRAFRALTLLLCGAGRRPLTLVLRRIGPIASLALILRTSRRLLTPVLRRVGPIGTLTLILRRIGAVTLLALVLRARRRLLTPVLRRVGPIGTLTLILHRIGPLGRLALILRRGRRARLRTLILRGRRRTGRTLILRRRWTAGRDARLTWRRAGGARRIVAKPAFLAARERLRRRDAIGWPDDGLRLSDGHQPILSDIGAAKLVRTYLTRSRNLNSSGENRWPHLGRADRTSDPRRDESRRNSRIDCEAALANDDSPVFYHGLADGGDPLTRRQHDSRDVWGSEVLGADENPDFGLFPIFDDDVIGRQRGPSDIQRLCARLARSGRAARPA
jgi:hypothetical protein